MKTIKTTFTAFFLFALLFVSNQLKAQYYPTWYSADTTHPAYATGSSFNANSDYINGFCYAWDATSPIAQGLVGSVYVNTFDLPPDITGLRYDEVYSSLSVTMPNTSSFGDYTAGIEGYGDAIYNLDPTNPVNIATRNFWYGYAQLLRFAGMDPGILYLTLGNSM